MSPSKRSNGACEGEVTSRNESTQINKYACLATLGTGQTGMKTPASNAERRTHRARASETVCACARERGSKELSVEGEQREAVSVSACVFAQEKEGYKTK